MDKVYIQNFISELEEKIDIKVTKNKYKDALELLSIAGIVLYNTNICYMKKKLESSIENIARKKIILSDTYKPKKNCVIFYDGFGLDYRGLAQIYLKALCKNYDVIYITKGEKKREIPGILNILNQNGSKVVYIDETSLVNKLDQMIEVINTYQPRHFFFYSLPWDTVGTVILNGYKGKIIRYQINLTDHTFWLGANAIDYCIEFRDYGASLSAEYRKIPKDKLVMLPYYPQINNIEFQGYPFEKGNNRVIFSGGALYKTFGGNNNYYKMVDYILNRYTDVIFWYAGTGDTSKLDKLIKKYPNRIYFTPERADLFQVLCHIDIYLSTYPITGGLMYQYAALAGKVPITLKYGTISDGVLLNQEKLGVEYSNLDDFYHVFDRLMTDNNYLLNQQECLKSAVITENVFEENLVSIIERGKTNFKIKYYDAYDAKFIQEYLDNYNAKKMCIDLTYGFYKSVFRAYPIRFILGVGYRLIRKIKENIKVSF